MADKNQIQLEREQLKDIAKHILAKGDYTILDRALEHIQEIDKVLEILEKSE